MIYKNIVPGVFLSRPNRFIAHVLVNGTPETVHVKNTGRCKELLVTGATVYLEKVSESSRKTKYDLVAVIKEKDDGMPILINMDSQAPNAAAAEWIKGIVSKLNDSTEYSVRTEVKYGNSKQGLFFKSNKKGTQTRTLCCIILRSRYSGRSSAEQPVPLHFQEDTPQQCRRGTCGWFRGCRIHRCG